MCKSYAFEYQFCNHKTQREYRFCPDRYTTCEGSVRWMGENYAIPRWCPACYLNGEHSLRGPPELEAYMANTGRAPAPLSIDTYGDIWERIRQNEILANIPENSLDMCEGSLTNEDADWLGWVVGAMECDILYKLARPESPIRDEKEILVLLNLDRAWQNWWIDHGFQSLWDLPGDSDDGYDEDEDEDEDEISDNSDRLLKPVDVTTLAEDKRECPICFETFGRSHNGTPCKTSCKHNFCYSCIKNWLENNSSCPMCRRELVDVDTPWWIMVLRGN